MAASPLSRELLHRCSIRLDLQASVPGEVFTQIASAASRGDTALAQRIANRLERRHRMRSIAVGSGCAVPHAAVPGLPRACVVYVRCATPVPMGASDRVPVRHLLALLVPTPGLSADYDVLVACTRLILQPDVIRALDAAREPADALAVLADAPRGATAAHGDGSDAACPDPRGGAR